VPKTAELRCQFTIGSEAIGIQTDSSSTRTRFFASADYTLTSLGPDRRTITSGYARVVDGLDIVNEQYFAADLETEQVQRRLAETVADRITTELSSYFARRA